MMIPRITAACDRTLTSAAIFALAVTLATEAAGAQQQAPLFAESKRPLAVPAYRIDIADINGDGIPDAGLVSSSWSAYQVCLGLGDGQLGAPVVTPMDAATTFSTRLADLDEDGRADRIRNDGGTHLFIDKGNGHGFFTTIGTYTAMQDNWETVTADLNDDGHLDVAMIGGDFLPGGVATWLGQGDGTLHDLFTIPEINMYSPSCLEAADANGDGHVDLLTKDLFSHLVFIPGKGDGGLLIPIPISLDVNYVATFGDMNVDGIPDLVSSDQTSLRVYLNDGTGSFSAPVLSKGPGSYYFDPHLQVDDFNGDGLPDVATVMIQSNRLFVSLGHGDGSFDDPLLLPVTGGAAWVRVADLDGNGSADLVVVDGTYNALSLLLNQRPAWPWELVGTGLAGKAGVPQLHGTGTLAAGTPVSLSLIHAKPNALAFLVLGSSLLSAPFKGGVLIPSPTIVRPQLTSAQGEAAISGFFPAGVPSLSRFYAQAWIPDALAPKGYAASNGVRAITP